MTIWTGWREQYERLRRSRARFSDMAEGRLLASSDEALDALIHFCQDGFHLRDWLGNDPQCSVKFDDVCKHVKNNSTLALCADLANGAKHFELTRPKTGDKSTGFTSQGVTVRAPTKRQRPRSVAFRISRSRRQTHSRRSTTSW